MKILGISGRMKSGKDFAAEHLKELYLSEHPGANVYIESFAGPLKEMLIQTFGFKHDDFYTQEGKASFNEVWGMTHREILQKTGTDAIRKNLHPDAWGFAMMHRLIYLRKNDDGITEPFVIIPDVRFVNEAKVVKRAGGKVLYIERPSLVTTKMKVMEKLHLVHPSEQPLPKEHIDYFLKNDGDITDFRRALNDFYVNEWNA